MGELRSEFLQMFGESSANELFLPKKTLKHSIELFKFYLLR